MATTSEFILAYSNILNVICNVDLKFHFTKYLKTRLKEFGFNALIVDTSTTPELLQMFFDTVGLDPKSEEHGNLKGVMMALLEEDKVFLNKIAEKVSQSQTKQIGGELKCN